jgi:hypothetical protein
MDPSSLTIVGGSARLLAAPGGVPQLVFAQPGPVEIRYRTGPGRGTVSMGSARWPTLSGEAAAFADGLRGTGVERAANRAEAWVRQRVAYDTSGDVARRHRSAIGEGLSFSDRCLLIGAGDCDVQNTLLGAILDRAGVEVRLAVGFVGAAGRALPGLHAWIEVLGDDRRWAAFDASRGGRGGIRRDPPDAVPRDVRAGRDPEPASAPPRVTVPGAVRSWWIVAVLVVVAAATGIWIHGRVRVHRVCRTDAADLSALLRGALDRPDAYREVPALFTRRVVPLLTGGAVSLARARALAAAGRLGVARSGSDVTRGAARRGWRVLDGNDIAAEEVAAALGAIDLDRWMGIADAGRSTPLTDAVERAAAGVGERWRIIVSRDPPDEVVVVELPGGERLIAIDPAGLLWLAVSGLMPGRPSAAGLILADELLDRVPVAAGRAQRLRSRLAAAALVETWGDAE